MAQPQPQIELGRRELFGGAISIDLPRDYLDVSNMRQVPDTQEAFVASTSETSVVVEVLQMVEEGNAGRDLVEALKYHWASLAHDNTALHAALAAPIPTEAPSRPQDPRDNSTPRPISLIGFQQIHKYTKDPSGAPRPGHEGDKPDDVEIALALFRCWRGSKKADVVLTVNVNLSAPGGKEEQARVRSWVPTAIKSFTLHDWELFPDSPAE